VSLVRKYLVSPSRSTINDFYAKNPFEGSKRAVVYLFKEPTARKPRRFCNNWHHQHFNNRLKDFIFSDECSVQRIPNLNGQYVTPLEGEAYRRGLVLIKPHVKDISPMVWAGIWLGGRTKLVIMERDSSPDQNRGYTSQSYIDALKEGLIEHYEPVIIFQQDLQPCILLLIACIAGCNCSMFSLLLHKEEVATLPVKKVDVRLITRYLPQGLEPPDLASLD
jgi:hypothetical protein